MAPQDGAFWQKNHDDNFDGPPKLKEYSYRPSTTPILPQPPMVTPIIIEIEIPLETTTGYPYKYKSYSYSSASMTPWWSSIPSATATVPASTITPTWTTSKIYPSMVIATTVAQFTGGDPYPTNSGGNDSSYWRPWRGPNDRTNNGNDAGIYAAAAVTPIVILAAIGLIIFLCMKKRKSQRMSAATGGTQAQEMKATQHSRPSIMQPYLAPLDIPSPPQTARRMEAYAPPADRAQPIILGPIPSGNNGAYMTGIDTSDVVSVTSANNLRPEPADPFSDNNSLSEPPPPYRPRSVGPPSFVTHSRNSSVRSTAPPITTRQISMQRSPFDDPIDDDAVSELSSPTTRSHDAMSVISDLSYQNELPTTAPSSRTRR